MRNGSPLNFHRSRMLYESGALHRPFALILLLGLSGLLLVFLVLRRSNQRVSQPSGIVGEVTANADPGGNPIRARENVAAREPFPRDPAVVTPDPTERARQLIEKLKTVNPGLVTAETIAENQEVLLSIESLNVAAIPALEEFFSRGDNVRFDPGPGTNLLGAPTLRMALLKLLLDFTAPENQEFEVRLLQSVSDPEEVALLADQLEAAAPGKYRESIREAAEASLRLAGEGRFPGQDTTPVLRILESFTEDEEPLP